MTTGRINQITIVYREGCGRRRGERRRDLKLLGGVHEGRAARSTHGLRHGHRARQSAFPLSVPQGIRPPHRTREGGVVWGPQEEDTAPGFGHCGVHRAWLPPDALFQDLPAASHPQNPFFSVNRPEPVPPPSISSTP